MALKATVHKVELTVSDTERHHYHTYNFKVACHPSETEGRMCLRLAAFALYASENMSFTRGLCATDEPDLWQKDDTGLIETWIDLGWPDEKRLAKASGLANKVIVVAYGRHTAPWWQTTEAKAERFKKLKVLDAGEDIIEQLAPLATLNMALTATISDGVLWFGNSDMTVEIPLHYLKSL
ncbi:YaeQ family protein [Marinagarivorans algicola]|uniref:YaeQ family protein n=1 Tax=Marinagarivorans algicola TaxID=1513270 RepID=UPI0006B5DB2C|nr:YaeQ family protein [Marinagarivorans algicola]